MAKTRRQTLAAKKTNQLETVTLSSQTCFVPLVNLGVTNNQAAKHSNKSKSVQFDLPDKRRQRSKSILKTSNKPEKSSKVSNQGRSKQRSASIDSDTLVEPKGTRKVSHQQHSKRCSPSLSPARHRKRSLSTHMDMSRSYSSRDHGFDRDYNNRRYWSPSPSESSSSSSQHVSRPRLRARHREYYHQRKYRHQNRYDHMDLYGYQPEPRKHKRYDSKHRRMDTSDSSSYAECHARSSRSQYQSSSRAIPLKKGRKRSASVYMDSDSGSPTVYTPKRRNRSQSMSEMGGISTRKY